MRNDHMKKVIDIMSQEGKEEEGPMEKWVRDWHKKPSLVKELKRKKGERSEGIKVRVMKEKKPQPDKMEKHREKEPANFSFNIVLAIAIAAVVIIGGGVLWSTLNAKLFLTLRMKQEPLELHEEVELNVTQTEVDVAKRIAPAKFIEEVQEKTQTFKATGVAFEDKKAEGTIKVYNNSNPPSALTLVVGTRFLSSGGGKVFKATEKIVLPAPVKQGSKVVASVTEVKVAAQEVGEDYNIGPSKFSIPGLSGTRFYYTAWGESEEAMTGGSRKEVAKISNVDSENARTNLYSALKDSALSAIKQEISDGYVLDGRALIEDDFSFTCSEPSSTTVTSVGELAFTCQGKLSLKALVYKADDLKALALDLFNKRKAASRNLREDSLQVSIVPKGAVTQSGRLVISLGAGIKTYEALNQDVFLNQILGKDKEQINQLVADNFPQVERVEAKFWPFWIRRAPSDAQRVKTRLTF